MKVLKDLMPKYYLPKGIIKSYNVIVNEDQPIDSDLKRYEEKES